MNIKLFTILLCSTVCLLNCKKTEEYFTTPVDLELLAYLPDSFLCEATKEVPGLGEVAWTANTFSSIKSNKLSIGFVTYEDTIDLYARERLIISNIPAQAGLYPIKPVDSNTAFCTYSRWASDGDALNASWEIDTEENNYIEITKLDSNNHLVSGKFDVYFKMTTQGSFGYVHSERINFRSGNFIAKIDQ
jgi:hypothetical protein